MATKVKRPRKNSKDDWVLHYDKETEPKARFVRLMLEMVGARYSVVKEDEAQKKLNVASGESQNAERKHILEHQNEARDVHVTELQFSSPQQNQQYSEHRYGARGRSIPPFPRLPMISKGQLEVSNIAVICRYLGEEYGLCPEAVEDRLLADQIVQYCCEYWSEASFVSAGNAMTEDDPPLEQGRMRYVEKFTSERMPMWLSYFEGCLKKNDGGKKFLFGKAMSYADLILYHVLRCTDSVYPSHTCKADYMPMLKAWKMRIASSRRVQRHHRSPLPQALSGGDYFVNPFRMQTKTNKH